MARDAERVGRTRRALEGAGLDVLVCALPANVLLLSGYWPVVGTSVALATREGRLVLLVPEDERALAEQGGADDLRTFHPGSLHRLTDAEEAVAGPLADAARALGIKAGRVGYEAGPAFEPSSYAALHLYGAGIPRLLGRAFPAAALVPADELLAGLRAVLTPREVGQVRTACAVAGRAFAAGAAQLRPGLREVEVAALFRAPLSTAAAGLERTTRADGFAFCMSGPNSAEAHGAYARSRGRPLAPGDFVLVHCNSYVGGYWTDITRTFCLGEPDARQAAMVAAVREASAAALAAVRPGVRGRDVDRAARQVLTAHGFGEQFKHSTGHGVGFAAIDHNARPRLHPASDDELQPGMVCNVEPALYIDGLGGLRHCDVVAVTETGAEVLTPFQSTTEQLVIPSA